MNSTVRSILAVLAGVVVGFLALGLVDYVGHLFYPLPAGLERDLEALKTYVATAPLGALLVVLLAWTWGTLSGGWVAARIAGRSHALHAGIVGTLVMVVFAIANVAMLPHPAWFVAAGVGLIAVAAWLAGRMAARSRPL